MITNTIAAGTARARLRWAALGVPAFTIGCASTQVMGRGTGRRSSPAAGPCHRHRDRCRPGLTRRLARAQRQVGWASRSTLAATLGASVGRVLYLPTSRWPPATSLGSPSHWPFTCSDGGRVPKPSRYAATCHALDDGRSTGSPALSSEWGVAWFTGGGLEGASAESVHPVLQKAVAHWRAMIPRSLAEVLLFAAWTALSPSLGPRRDPTGGDWPRPPQNRRTTPEPTHRPLRDISTARGALGPRLPGLPEHAAPERRGYFTALPPSRP